MIRDTSLAAYQRMIASGKRPPQWMIVFQAVNRSANGLTRSEIEGNTGLKLAAVCGRVNELIKEGILSDTGTRKCRATKERAHVVIVTERF